MFKMNSLLNPPHTSVNTYCLHFSMTSNVCWRHCAAEHTVTLLFCNNAHVHISVTYTSVDCDVLTVTAKSSLVIRWSTLITFYLTIISSTIFQHFTLGKMRPYTDICHLDFPKVNGLFHSLTEENLFWEFHWLHLLRISAVAYFGIIESMVSSGWRMQPCV